MNRGRHVRMFGAVAGIALAATVCTTPTAVAEPGTDATPPDANGFRSVTLLTGDQVLVSATQPADSGPIVRPGAGRERMSFSTHTDNGHLYVIPTDAAQAVEQGQLDRRLFDITTLIEFGYDDTNRNTLPLIITYDGAARANLAAAGGTVTRELPSINGTAIDADKNNAASLWNTVTAGDPSARAVAAGVRTVWLDGKHTASLDRSAPQIGAPAAWAAGYTGAGVTIAVLDTGVDQTHPDLAGQEIAERNFTTAPDIVDRRGHGTHVASTAAGTGAKAGGKYTGVAHGAKILDGKVLNDGGGGQSSWTIAGMEWAAEQGAKIANLSLGGSDSPAIDPLEQAVNTLSAQHGILFVIAAGNAGQPESILSPGSADAALTVGAVDREERLASFSSRGPRTGDRAIKPDITAPGVGIAAAKAANGVIGTPVEDGYVSVSGTSMATPHVAGAAALVAQQHPTWTGAQLKAALTASARPNPALTVFEQGSGRVDVAKAIAQTLTSEPTSVSLGVLAWPHDDGQSVTKPLTYHNPGPSDVTLNLTVDAKGPDGHPAPAGIFGVSSNQITVPAGGQTQVTVTGSAGGATLDGDYTGTILATSGESTLRTPVAINREPESYDLTVSVLDPDGAPTDRYAVLVTGYDNGLFRVASDPDGTVTLRLPPGRYFVDVGIRVGEREGDPRFYVLAAPNVSVNGDTTLDADARTARPISVTVPDPAARSGLFDLGFDVRTPNGRRSSVLLNPDISRVFTAQLGPAAPADVLTTRVHAQLTAPDGAFYGLAWFQFGTVPTGFTKVLSHKDLATLHADFGSTVPNRRGERFAVPLRPDGSAAAASLRMAVPLPSTRTEFYNTDGFGWETTLLQLFGAGRIEASFTSEHPTLAAGHTRHVRYNHAPFGPAFPKTRRPWAQRLDDAIFVRVPLFADSSGNAGTSLVASANTRLFRNGELVGENPNPGLGTFRVPAEDADYRLTAEATRPRNFDLTTKISAAWTFRSGHPTGTGAAPLPLSAIRFFPVLDNANTAPAGRPFLVPVVLQQQTGALTRPHRLTVDVSYDEGTTWHNTHVIGNLAVLLHHPADARSVSLRAHATDRHGNTVEHTIIRAYKLAP